VRSRYQLQRVLIDTRPSEAQNRKLKQHWAEVALSASREGRPARPLFSYNLFAIDQRLRGCRQLHLEYYERVREIVTSRAGGSGGADEPAAGAAERRAGLS
jgi:hypothetical protein